MRIAIRDMRPIIVRRSKQLVIRIQVRRRTFPSFSQTFSGHVFVMLRGSKKDIVKPAGICGV